jgi:hypothetical protein
VIVVELVKDDEVALYGDFDARFAGGNVERAALGQIPMIDFAPFVADSTLVERQEVGRKIRSPASTSASSTSPGTASPPRIWTR